MTSLTSWTTAEQRVFLRNAGANAERTSAVFFTTQYGAKYLASGKYNDYPVLALHMARSGNLLYFTFDYQTGGDNDFYGTGSPLTESSPRVERTLCKSLALFEIERFLNNKLTNDTNLTEKSRKGLLKKFEKLKAKIDL